MVKQNIFHGKGTETQMPMARENILRHPQGSKMVEQNIFHGKCYKCLRASHKIAPCFSGYSPSVGIKKAPQVSGASVVLVKGISRDCFGCDR